MMPDVKDSVGEGGLNNVHDVALVQAMLVLVKNAKNAPYLDTYDGVYGKNTKTAIIAFQTDQVIPVGPPAPGEEPLGLVRKGDRTIQQLNKVLPAAYKEATVLEGGKTVYLSASDADMKASKQDVSAAADLEVNFRGKVATLIDEMYQNHKIVLWVTPAWAKGMRRTFETQYQLMFKVEDGKLVTNAGPGESNHNFGQAVDIGFKNLQWLKGSGTIVQDEDWWLHKLKQVFGGAVKQKQFWAALRDVAINGTASLFRGPESDYPHIQAWNDAGIDMATRLAALLTSVGQMKWTGAAQRYQSDFGLGGALYNVGTAKQIWSGQAPVSKTDLAKARTEAFKKAAVLAGPNSDAWKKFKPITAMDIKGTEIAAMQKSLKNDFVTADQNWTKWKAF